MNQFPNSRLLTAIAAGITLCTAIARITLELPQSIHSSSLKYLDRKPYLHHHEAPPTRGSEAKIAVNKGAIMKRPLSFELYGLGSRLYMTVEYVFRKLYNDQVQWLIKSM